MPALLLHNDAPFVPTCPAPLPPIHGTPFPLLCLRPSHPPSHTHGPPSSPSHRCMTTVHPLPLPHLHVPRLSLPRPSISPSFPPTSPPPFPPACPCAPCAPPFPPACTRAPRAPPFPPACARAPRAPPFPPACARAPRAPPFPPARTCALPVPCSPCTCTPPFSPSHVRFWPCAQCLRIINTYIFIYLLCHLITK